LSVGLIIQEATAVSPEGRISPEDLGLEDEQIENCNKLTIHQQSKRSSGIIHMRVAKSVCSLEWQ
jgi:2,4-dienoyl-CoA reductase-like NADH-dependent reductase (Old Yellow Enzyme family)